MGLWLTADRYGCGMRRIIKWVLVLFAINTVAWAIGQAITRSKTSSDLASDELEVYTFWMGREVVSQSSNLKTVKSRVVMGGATIDLRQANPSSEGVTVDVGTLMGGTALLVPKDWDVRVEEQTKSSGVEVQLDTDAAVPSDSPKVTVLLRTTYGGALVGYALPSEH